MLGAHSQEPGEVFWTRHHLYPCLKGWDSLGRGPWIPPPKASRNPRETLYLSPHIFLFSLGPPPASFLRAGRSCEQPRPPPPSSQPCVTQSKGHLGQPRPVTQWHATQPGKSLFSLSAQASCRPQTGRPALRGGSSGRQGGPLRKEGPGPGRKDGRQRGGHKRSPSHRGTLAGGRGEGGPGWAFLPRKSQPAGWTIPATIPALALYAGGDPQKSPIQAGQKIYLLLVQESPAVAP